MPMPPALLTIGHSNHPIERFLGLLQGAGVALLADVRTMPASRHCPQFNRAPLARSLADAGVAYVHWGDDLGGRPRDPALRAGGAPDYEAMAAAPAFRSALDRVQAEAGRRPLALMCAEREPLDCHRVLLVSRRLAERGQAIRHILANGTLEDHAATEDRLLALTGQASPDLFAPDRPARLAEAYRLRTDRFHPARA
jgi:uncharacterized protein (DUF488 family)